MQQGKGRPTLGFWRCWALVVGGMIGSGIFMLPSVLAPYGSYSLMAWLVSGCAAMFIALMFAQLARRLPKVGGPYAYTRAAFGDLPGFLTAWGHWLSICVAYGAAAVAFVDYTNPH